MSKGCKIWLWLLLIANVLASVGLVYFWIDGYVLTEDLISAVVCGVVLIAGVCILLFKQNKIGFYLILVASIMEFVYSLMFKDVPLNQAVIGAAILPLITFLFLRKSA